MPTPISAALGTERQFTPQPEHGYVGQYVGVSPVNVSASTAHDDQLAQNFAQLGAALTSYRVSHERYLAETGHIDSERMIKGMTEADIKKLNAIDAAQQEGFADCLSNPYFKAHAEKLRGGFLSTVMKNQYDEKYALTPARSAEEEANRYRKFSKDWQSANLSGDKAPINEIAFNTGFNENQLVNMANLMGTWEKKNYENEVTTVMAASTSKLDDIVKSSAELLKTNGEMTAKTQEVFNEVRLMGLPLQYKTKLLTDYCEQLIKTGHLDEKRLGQMMDNIVIQTNLDGSEMRASDLLPMMQFRTMAAEYNRQQFTQAKYDWVKQQIERHDLRATIGDIDVMTPEEQMEYRPLVAKIDAGIQHADAEAAAERRAQMARAGRTRSAGGSGRNISDSYAVSDIISGWMQGNDIVNGMPVKAYTIDKQALFGNALPLLQKYVADGDWQSTYRLMDMPQLSAMCESCSASLANILAGIMPSDDGGVNIGDNPQLMSFVSAVMTNPAAVGHTFGGDLAREASTLATFSTAYGGGEWGNQQALRLYAESHQTAKEHPDVDKENERVAGNSVAGYTIDNVPSGNYGTTDIADLGLPCNQFVASDAKKMWKAQLNAGMAQDTVQHNINEMFRQNYTTYHWGIYPNNVTYNMETDNNAHWFAQALDQAIYDTCKDGGGSVDYAATTICYNPAANTFTFSSPTLGVSQSYTQDQLRSIAEQLYADSRKDDSGSNGATDLDKDAINAQRLGETGFLGMDELGGM